MGAKPEEPGAAGAYQARAGDDGGYVSRRAVRELAVVLILVVGARDTATSPSAPKVHSSRPEIRTAAPVPPGPVFVPVNVQWYSTVSSLKTTSSMITSMSGNASMNERAASMASAGQEGLVPGYPPI
jgi:hypothetical protein